MKRVFDILVGLVFMPFGAACVVGGFLRFYHAASAMGDGKLSPDQSAEALIQLLIGLAIVALGYWAATSGWARFMRGIRGTPAPATAAAAPVAPAAEPAAPPAVASSPPKPVSAPKKSSILSLSYGAQSVLLTPRSGEAVLGRGADCRIVVASKHVSRAHARIVWDEDGSPRLVNLGQPGTSICRKGDSSARPCDPSLVLEGEGTIALSADYAGATGRGDAIGFEVSPG